MQAPAPGGFSAVVARLEELLTFERYSVAGVLKGGRLLVPGVREGVVNLYAFDYMGSRRLAQLNRGSITWFLEAPYGAERVVFVRDVSGGREQEVLVEVRVDRPGVEELLAPGLRPMRIFGAADDGVTVVFTASTEEEVAVYAARRGEAWRVAAAPGLPLVEDVEGRVAAGIYFSRERPGVVGVFTVDLEEGVLRSRLVEGGSVTSVTLHRGRLVYALETGEGVAALRSMDPWSLEDLGPALPEGSELEGLKPSSIVFLDSAPGGRLVAVARRRGRSAIFVDGRRVNAPQGSHGSAYLVSGRVVYSHNSLTSPTKVMETDLESGEYRVVLAGNAPAWLEGALAGSRYVEVESFDDSPVPTYVLESGAAEVPGPTVVLVHGGPFGEDADQWNVMAAALAATGFHVVMPNYRGSTGYGEEWRTKIIGDPCGGELEDVVSAAKWALSSGLASRVYIMGYSYGGYITLCALTRKPGVFRAGVAGASIADWEEAYRLSDALLRSFIELLFAGRRELWRERSPVTHASNLRDPLCIVHPQNDTRTPLLPVLHFMEKLSVEGKRFEAHIAPDMGHLISSMEDAVKVLLPALLFLVRMERRAGESSGSGGS